MNFLPPPTARDWGEIPEWGDEKNAYDHFFGKSLDDAAQMLSELPEHYCEDFFYMPEKPFRYYLQAYRHHLTSDSSYQNWLAASSFFGLIDLTIRHHRRWLEESWESTCYVLFRLRDRAEFYDDNLKEHQRYARRVERILKLWDHGTE